MFNFLGFNKVVKEVEVDIAKDAQIAVLGAETALLVFSKLISEVTVANAKLKIVVAECEKAISEKQTIQDKANASILEYEALITNFTNMLGVAPAETAPVNTPAETPVIIIPTEDLTDKVPEPTPASQTPVVPPAVPADTSATVQAPVAPAETVVPLVESTPLDTTGGTL
jgi:hypothetical protein